MKHIISILHNLHYIPFYNRYIFQELASKVSDAELEEGRLFPPMSDIFNVSTELAANVVQYAYEHNVAAMYPEPVDKLEFVKAHQYTADYDSFLPYTYDWPGITSE